MAYVLTIAGSTKAIQPGWSMTSSVNGRATLQCEIVSTAGSYRPAIGAEVILTEGGTTIFGGYIDAPAEQGIGARGDTAITTRISCVDYNSLGDRRFVIDGGFPSGYTMLQCITSLAGYLTAYGVAVDAAQATGPTLTAPIVYDVKSITAILDELAIVFSGLGGTSYIWRIDPATKKLRMFTVGTFAAPVNITEASRYAEGDVTVEPTRANYANKIILLAGTGTSEVTETYTGDGFETDFQLTYALASHNGTVTNAGTPETLAVQGTGFDLAATWLYHTSTRLITRAVAPANGNAISITYIAQFPYVTTAQDAGEIATNGLWERVIEAPDVFTATQADTMVGALLARAITTSQTVRYVTRQLGIHPGQIQTITLSKRNLSGIFLITDVQTQNSAANVVTRTVTATGGSVYLGSWRDDFASGGSGSSGVTVGSSSIITVTGTSGIGTSGKLAKWATSTTLGDSIISESGSVATVAGTVAATLFSGSGENLTSLPAGQLIGTITPSVQDLLTRTGTLVSGATGAGFTLALAVSTVTGNLPYANMPAGAGTWTGTPTISGAVTINNQLSVNANITTPALTNLTLNPTGDLMLDPSGQDVLPVTNYTLNIGLPQQKFLTLCAAELIVENLVAADVRSTVGGRILVAPTTEIVLDLASGGTTITTRHNNLSVGDIIHMESRGQVEFMLVTALGGTVSVPWYASGTLSLLFSPVIVLTAYTFTVTRNLDGSGANNWIAGDGVVNTRTTGKGFIDLYAASGILSGVGPTIVGNVRTGTAYQNIEPRWVVGNLNAVTGLGYGTDIYGAFFGVATAAWVKIDPTNGIRIGHNATTKISLDAAGNATFAGTVAAADGNIGNWVLASGFLYRDNGSSSVGMGTSASDWAFWAGNPLASRNTAPFRVTTAGDLTATSGAIGGFTLSSTTFSATNLTLVSGAANTARIEAGSGSNIGGINSPNGSGDWLFWGGDTHPNRAAAPFRVQATGLVYAGSLRGSGSAGHLTVGAASGVSGATLTLDGWSTINFGIGGFTVQAIDTNGDLRPAIDNTMRVGLATNRYTLIRGVTITPGDLLFENGWAFTESYKVGIEEPGIALLNAAGEIVTFFGDSGCHTKPVQDVDSLPHAITTSAERAEMDAHHAQRIKAYADDGSAVFKTHADVRPLPKPGQTNRQRSVQ